MKTLTLLKPAPRGLIFATLLALGAVSTAQASFSDDHDRKDHRSKQERKLAEQQAIRSAVARGNVMPLPKLMAIAQKQVPGDILEVELERREQGFGYEFKILTPDGRIRKIELNAKTGAVVKIKDD